STRHAARHRHGIIPQPPLCGASRGTCEKTGVQFVQLGDEDLITLWSELQGKARKLACGDVNESGLVVGFLGGERLGVVRDAQGADGDVLFLTRLEKDLDWIRRVTHCVLLLLENLHKDSF